MEKVAAGTKYQIFAAAYLACGVAWKAAAEAGYKGDNQALRVNGRRLLRHPEVIRILGDQKPRADAIIEKLPKPKPAPPPLPKPAPPPKTVKAKVEVMHESPDDEDFEIEEGVTVLIDRPVLDRVQCMQLLTGFALNPREKSIVRIKAVDLLTKIQGHQTQKVDVSVDGHIAIGIQVYLPSNARERLRADQLPALTQGDALVDVEVEETQNA